MNNRIISATQELMKILVVKLQNLSKLEYSQIYLVFPIIRLRLARLLNLFLILVFAHLHKFFFLLLSTNKGLNLTK